MGFLCEERLSDSPFIESVMRGRSEGNGSMVRPAECHWHMVVARLQGSVRVVIAGPWTSAGTLAYIEGIELLWIKFRLGAFLPHLPLRGLLNRETLLPDATNQSFWLHGSSWQLPGYDNAETFVARLARDGALTCDPLVADVLCQQSYAVSPRTLRHRFLRATGLAQTQIHQFERAQQAAALLRRGISIADAVYEAGYFDQPHLTRSLKHWIGHTPAQLLGTLQSEPA
jgi:AraC-like DNA-binding protein